LTSVDTGALVVDRQGRVIGRHVSTAGEPTPPELPRALYTPVLFAGDQEQHYVVPDGVGGQTLVALVPIPPRREALGVVLLSTSLRRSTAVLYEHMLSMLLAGLLVLLLTAIAIFFTVHANLRPLERMLAVAQHIAKGDLSQRVSLPQGNDEIGLLARSFDEMVDHIQAAFTMRAQTEARLRQFLADVSHELRTPLTAIGAYTDVLLGAATRHYVADTSLLQAMRREIDRTSRLVQDLLLLARSDRATTFNMQPVDLSSVCGEVAEQVRLMLGERTLQTEIVGQLSVIGDADRIQQVLLNLLDNAVRHTPTGTQIELHLTARGFSAWVSIADTGPGFPPASLPYIFERFFYTAHAVDAEQHSGLGLAIAKAIVEAHGGAIVAFNRPTGGACVQLRLPLRRPA
jgi:two-component system OmpR family sensor kinase